jgi:hypothetical protein
MTPGHVRWPDPGALTFWGKGRLVGKSTNAYPIILVERASGGDDLDLLHALEIRVRVSAGTNLSARLMGPPPLDFKTILDELEGWPWTTKTKLTPDGEFHTYVLTPQIFEPPRKSKPVNTGMPRTRLRDESIRLSSAKNIWRKFLQPAAGMVSRHLS